MRNGEKYKYANARSNSEIARELSKFVGLSSSSNSFNHIVELHMLALIHKLAITSRNTNSKLKDIDIEIPFIGKLSLSIIDGDLIINNLKFEEEYKKYILDAVNKGDSPLVDHVNEKFIKNVQNKYKEIL